MVRADDILGDAQAETRPRDLALHGRTPVKSFENAALFLGRDPFAVICHRRP